MRQCTATAPLFLKRALTLLFSNAYNTTNRVSLMSEDSLRSLIVEYLGKGGYLTRGFVGDGPIRMGFAEVVEDVGDTVVGLKVIRNDPCLECEVVAVKILGKSSSDNFGPATRFAQKVAANKCIVAGSFVFDASNKDWASFPTFFQISCTLTWSSESSRLNALIKSLSRFLKASGC